MPSVLYSNEIATAPVYLIIFSIYSLLNIKPRLSSSVAILFIRWNASNSSSHTTELSTPNGSMKNSNSFPLIGVIYLSDGDCNTSTVNVVLLTTAPSSD